MSNNWSSARTQAALNAALELREAGNQVFRAENYQLSTDLYGEASYDVLHLNRMRHIDGIPSND